MAIIIFYSGTFEQRTLYMELTILSLVERLSLSRRSNSMGLNQVSFVERLSLSRRFHCRPSHVKAMRLFLFSLTHTHTHRQSSMKSSCGCYRGPSRPWLERGRPSSSQETVQTALTLASSSFPETCDLCMLRKYFSFVSMEITKHLLKVM